MIPPRLTTRHVAVIVAEDYGRSLAMMRGASRKSVDTLPRQVAMFLAHHQIGCSLSEIGRFFDRDHTTVLHAIRTVTEKTAQDDALRDRLQCLGERIAAAEGAIIAGTWIPPEPKAEAPLPVTVVLAPPRTIDDPRVRRVIDAVRGYVQSRKALSAVEHTKLEFGARRQVEAEYALLDSAWQAYAAGRDRS